MAEGNGDGGRATPPQKALTQPEFEGLADDAIINDENGNPINPRPTTFEEGKFFAPPGGDGGAAADAAADAAANGAAEEAAPVGVDGGGDAQLTDEQQQEMLDAVEGNSLELLVRQGKMTKEFALKQPNLTPKQKQIINEIVVKNADAEVVKSATDGKGGRRRTKRKGRKGSRKSRKGAKKGAKKSKKSGQSSQSQNGGRRRSSKNRRKHSHRRKH
jgi:hypothetical protein